MTDLTEPAVGYRSWLVNETAGTLMPLFMGRNGPWTRGPQHAACDSHHNLSNPYVAAPARSEHRAPGSFCHCGFNAYHVPQTAETATVIHFPAEVVRIQVFGSIIGWGTVQVHERGFRAEYAQITALTASERVDLSDIAAGYDIPLVDAELLCLEACRHGEPIPEQLRPSRLGRG